MAWRRNREKTRSFGCTVCCIVAFSRDLYFAYFVAEQQQVRAQFETTWLPGYVCTNIQSVEIHLARDVSCKYYSVFFVSESLMPHCSPISRCEADKDV